jgi:hypothetical protein
MTVVAAAMVRAMAIGRRGVTWSSSEPGRRYSSVAVPVMFGWTVHRKVYDPAASAGTS